MTSKAELRQRRRGPSQPNNNSPTDAKDEDDEHDNNSPSRSRKKQSFPPQRRQQQKTSQQQQQQTPRLPLRKKIFAFLFVLCYITIAIFINPTTIAHWYWDAIRPTCIGTCYISNKPDSSTDGCGGPIDPTHLIFLRIPKTASTTLKKIFALQSATYNKNVHQIDLGEIEDLVPSLPRPNTPLKTQGYHDPTIKASRQRVNAFHTNAVRSMVYPQYRGQNKTLFHGHLYHDNDWSMSMKRMVSKPTYVKYLPKLIRRLYKWDPQPTYKELRHNIQEISMIRKPQDRLASMYYYDRHEARTDWWRSELVLKRGNVTLEECLLDKHCVKVNELRRWCSIQVEMLCGFGRECTRPVTTQTLEVAKRNVKERRGIFVVGVMERMDESLILFEHLLPTYLEGVSKLVKTELPRERENLIKRREDTYSVEAQKVLDDICKLDNELYDYVNGLLSERMERCNIKV